MLGHSSLEDFSNLGAQKCLFLSFRRTSAENKYEGKCNSRLIHISGVISKAQCLRENSDAIKEITSKGRHVYSSDGQIHQYSVRTMRKIDQTSRFNDKNQCFQAIYKKNFCLYVYKDAMLLAFFRWFWIVQLFSAFKGLVKTEMSLLQGHLLPYKHHTRFGRILFREMLPSVKLLDFKGHVTRQTCMSHRICS